MPNIRVSPWRGRRDVGFDGAELGAEVLPPAVEVGQPGVEAAAELAECRLLLGDATGQVLKVGGRDRGGHKGSRSAGRSVYWRRCS
jgi:hypothetical protein